MDPLYALQLVGEILRRTPINNLEAVGLEIAMNTLQEAIKETKKTE